MYRAMKRIVGNYFGVEKRGLNVELPIKPSMQHAAKFPFQTFPEHPHLDLYSSNGPAFRNSMTWLTFG